MSNVAASALDARAQLIGNAIGASPSLVQRAAYFDVGGRYRLMARGRWDPYVMLGFGAASVKTRTNFSINGVDVTNGDLVVLGTDLVGHVDQAVPRRSASAQRCRSSTATSWTSAIGTDASSRGPDKSRTTTA